MPKWPGIHWNTSSIEWLEIKWMRDMISFSSGDFAWVDGD
jgi:hypothetical protein